MKYQYSKEKAYKLIEVYEEKLLGQTIDPYGTKKKMYELYRMYALSFPTVEQRAHHKGDKKKMEAANTWRVIVVAKHKSEPDIEKDLEDILKMKKIKHDIDSIKL